MPTSRITFVGDLYFQADGIPDSGQTLRFSNQCASNSLPYSRTIELTEDWIPFDYGWIPKEFIGLLILRNEGVQRQVYPSFEELRNDEQRIILIGYCPKLSVEEKNRTMWSHVLDETEPEPLFRIRPNQGCLIELVDPSKWWLCCMKGTTRCCLFLTPN